MEECGISKRDGDGSCPFGGAFRPYTPTISRTAAAADGSLPISSSLRVNLRRPLVSRLSKDIVKTFQLCNPNFKYSDALNPKRFLTDPSAGVSNDGYDNANSDLILHVNSVLINSSTSQRYLVKEMLGQGTFGQVAKCWVSESNSYVAVKVIKNHTAYYRQALVEVSILTMLNQMLGLDEKCHIVRVLDHFVYQRHLCISFEMLGSNLYELIRMKKYTGFPLSIVQVFSKQILHALVVIKDAGIIHCDLKPENILLSTSAKPEIKVIDFGSACMEGHTVYSYIQSRYYRSPEVLLGYPYTTAIDMWSFGCIVAELFLGFPLFGGASEYDLLKRMIKILGGQPPDDILRNARGTDKFFKHVASIYHSENDQGNQKITSIYRMLTEEEYEVRLSTKPIIGKHYFSQVKLEDIIATYPYRKDLSEQEISKESITRLALVDFLRGLVEFDPRKRWSPLQASGHPFVTGEPFLCPYKPPPETPRIHVINPITVDHNPGGGHWLAAGLSPQITNANRCFLRNNPHFYMVPLSHHSSFGSMGSHCSYNDNTVPGSGYGSYGDIDSVYSYFSPVGPCGQNIQTQVGGQYLGASPDAWHRPHMSHGNGFGASPNGSLGPMSLGASPSQFTPPGSLMQISTVSPGKYGATSPARVHVHGSPFGKAAAIGQYNRSSWCYPGTSIQPHESASQLLQGHHGDAISRHSDTFSQGHLASPPTTLVTSNLSNWRRQMGPSSSNHAFPAPGSFNANAVASHSAEILRDKPEIYPSLPDPADWDPTCSDVFLLEEDNSEVSSLASAITSNVCLGKASDAFLPSEAGKSVHNHNQACTNSKFVSSSQRIEGLFPPYSHAESGSHIAQDLVSAYSRLPPFPQNPPSRFGQQPVHGYNQHSTYMHVERIHNKGQPARSNYPVADSFSAANTMLGSGMSWGRRGGHPIGTTLPSCDASKD